MTFKKPELLYKTDALEPYIDKVTMELHHQKHHTAYVNGLSGLSTSVPSNLRLHGLLGGVLHDTGLGAKNRDILMRFGGGHYNHSLFWQYMSPDSNVEKMSPMLKERIEKDFVTFEAFKTEFGEKAASVFGSGWCWWVFNIGEKKDPDDIKSCIMTTHDQLNPIMEDSHNVCLLGLDVWEHAYYVKYRNERPKYIENWWNVVNWETVSRIHDELATKKKPLAISDDGYIVFEGDK